MSVQEFLKANFRIPNMYNDHFKILTCEYCKKGRRKSELQKGIHRMLCFYHHFFLLQHIHRFLNETWISRYHMELSPDLLTFLWSVIASIFSLGGLCGALIGGSMAIRLGR